MGKIDLSIFSERPVSVKAELLAFVIVFLLVVITSALVILLKRLLDRWQLLATESRIQKPIMEFLWNFLLSVPLAVLWFVLVAKIMQIDLRLQMLYILPFSLSGTVALIMAFVKWSYKVIKKMFHFEMPEDDDEE